MSTEGSMARRAPVVLREAREALPLGVTVLAAGVLCFMAGGYLLDRSGPAVIGYLLAAVVCIWLAVRWESPSRAMTVALVLFGVFVAWTGASLLWSLAPDGTWSAFNVSALYLAVVAFVGLSSVRRPQLHIGVWLFLVACAAVAVSALLDKARPDLTPVTEISARLADPVGYWNGLALLMIMALPVGLALAAGHLSRLPVRAAAAGCLVPVAFTFFFTFSRGGWLVLAVALVVYFALTDRRLPSFFSLACVVLTTAGVVYHLRAESTLFAATAHDALRVTQARSLFGWAAAAVFVTAGLQVLVVVGERRVRWPRQVAAAAGVAIVVVLVGAVTVTGPVFLSRHGGVSFLRQQVTALAKNSGSTPSGDAGRLTSANTGRPPLWREAVHQWETHPFAGSGAGTFPLTHYRFRTVASVVKHAHSEWFNTLSELGLVGLLLFVAALAALFVAAARSVWQCRADPSRALLVALLASAVAFVVHISWDWEWGMTGIGVSAFALLAAVLAYARSIGGTQTRAGVWSSWRGKAVASAALVLLAASWTPAYLSVRAAGQAVVAAGNGRTEAALDLSRRAATLDPLAVDPLFTQAQALQRLGRTGEALSTLKRASRLQPENYEVWLNLGKFQATVLGDESAARASFTRALALNPLDRSTLEELRLVGE